MEDRDYRHPRFPAHQRYPSQRSWVWSRQRGRAMPKRGKTIPSRHDKHVALGIPRTSAPSGANRDAPTLPLSGSTEDDRAAANAYRPMAETRASAALASESMEEGHTDALEKELEKLYSPPSTEPEYHMLEQAGVAKNLLAKVYSSEFRCQAPEAEGTETQFILDTLGKDRLKLGEDEDIRRKCADACRDHWECYWAVVVQDEVCRLQTSCKLAPLTSLSQDDMSVGMYAMEVPKPLKWSELFESGTTCEYKPNDQGGDNDGLLISYGSVRPNKCIALCIKTPLCKWVLLERDKAWQGEESPECKLMAQCKKQASTKGSLVLHLPQAEMLRREEECSAVHQRDLTLNYTTSLGVAGPVERSPYECAELCKQDAECNVAFMDCGKTCHLLKACNTPQHPTPLARNCSSFYWQKGLAKNLSEPVAPGSLPPRSGSGRRRYEEALFGHETCGVIEDVTAPTLCRRRTGSYHRRRTTNCCSCCAFPWDPENAQEMPAPYTGSCFYRRRNQAPRCEWQQQLETPGYQAGATSWLTTGNWKDPWDDEEAEEDE